MPSQLALRNAMLLKLRLASAGDVRTMVNLEELATSLGIQIAEARIIASQIDAKKWAEFSGHFEGGKLSITMMGVEEAEKIGQPLLKKLSDNYPFLYQCCWSIITLLVGTFILWLLGWKR